MFDWLGVGVLSLQRFTTRPSLTPCVILHNSAEVAKKEVSASCSENAPSQSELRKWNETFGENTNTWKTSLTYFS